MITASKTVTAKDSGFPLHLWLSSAEQSNLSSHGARKSGLWDQHPSPAPRRLTSSSPNRQLVPHCNHTPTHILFLSSATKTSRTAPPAKLGVKERENSSTWVAQNIRAALGVEEGGRAAFSSSCPSLSLFGLSVRNLASSHCSYKQVLLPGKAAG